jgi:pilus assembly protein Flp/PilA
MLSSWYVRLRTRLTQTVTETLNGRNTEEGQGMVEYALILVLIAIVVIVILAVVGKKVSTVFSNINNGLG